MADALLVLAALLNRNGDLATTRVVLAEAHRVLTAIDDRWGLATHDLFTAGHLAPMGDLDAAEASARASVAGFQAIGEQFLVLDSLGMLAGVAEARGDLEGAADHVRAAARTGSGRMAWRTTSRCGSSGSARLRARQDDDATAEQLFAEAVARSDGPTMRGTALDRSGRCDTPPR